MTTFKKYIAFTSVTFLLTPAFAGFKSSDFLTVQHKKTLFSEQIKSIASNSSCADVSWKSRGRAPAGYIKGMALSYARSLCRIRGAGSLFPAAKILMSPNSQNAKKDVLAYYKDILANSGIHVNITGKEPVEAVYTVGIGLGMRESSGKYCEGWDKAAGTNRSSAEAEAGPFQTSYNSISSSPELKRLYQEYQASPDRCMLSVFKEGVSCKSQSVLGTGAGASYQAFSKTCPAFAAEYAMTLLRLLRTHFGPINRKEAQVVPACESLLRSVYQIIDHDPEATCSELF